MTSRSGSTPRTCTAWIMEHTHYLLGGFRLASQCLIRTHQAAMTGTLVLSPASSSTRHRSIRTRFHHG
jgi:hypothetical protein